jgi:hypothetical protein
MNVPKVWMPTTFRKKTMMSTPSGTMSMMRYTDCTCSGRLNGEKAVSRCRV